MKFTWRSLCCLVVCLPLASCGLFCVWSTGIGQKTVTWEQFDSLQVLAGPDEMWLFLEVDRMIRLPGAMVSAPTRSTGHRQIVLVVKPGEAPRRVLVQPDSGASFHMNLGHVFRHGDHIYLFKGASRYSRRSVFVWKGEAFEPLPAAECEELLRSNGLSDLSPAEFEPALDRLSERSDWNSLMVETSFAYWSEAKGEIVPLPEERIEWAGRSFTWEQETTPSGVSVSLHVRGDEAESRIPVLQYDPQPVPMSRR